MYGFISIGIGAAVGAWLRWWLGIRLNHIFPTIPMGTLAANIVGGFCMGIVMAITKNHTYISETARLLIITGFLGGLTTFSTFSAETVFLLSNQEYLFAFTLVIAHLVGSLLATFFGIYVIKILTF